MLSALIHSAHYSLCVLYPTIFKTKIPDYAGAGKLSQISRIATWKMLGSSSCIWHRLHGWHCSGALHSSTGELLHLWQLFSAPSFSCSPVYLYHVIISVSIRVCRTSILNQVPCTLSSCILASSLIACCGCQRRSCKLLSSWGFLWDC